MASAGSSGRYHSITARRFDLARDLGGNGGGCSLPVCFQLLLLQLKRSLGECIGECNVFADVLSDIQIVDANTVTVQLKDDTVCCASAGCGLGPDRAPGFC